MRPLPIILGAALALTWAPVVGVGKGGAGHRLDSQVVKALDAGFHTGDTIP
jgi:hypothetical protein